MVRVEFLKKQQAEEVVKLLVEAFEQDPYSWSRALNRPPERFRTYMSTIYVPSLTADNAAFPSLVAIDDSAGGDSEKIVGVLTLEDFRMSDDTRKVEEEARDPISGMLGAGHDIFWDELGKRKGETKETAGKICYYGFLAVNKDYRRKQIGASLVKRGIEEARAARCRYGVAFCTSPKSINLFQQLGSEKWGEVIYHNFRLRSDGSLPYTALPDSMSVAVLPWENDDN